MITNTKILEKYCTDYKKIENYEEAVKSPLRYDLHHRLEISEMQSRTDLIFLHLYYHRPPEELIFLSHGEHIRLHKEGKHPSAETRQKISEAKKGKNMSAESRQKMSDAQKGHHCSEDTKQKISDAKKGNQNALGHLVSEDIRKRMSEARKGRHWHLENSHRIWTD